MKKNLLISSLLCLFLGASIGSVSAQVYTDATSLTLTGKAETTDKFYHRIDTAKYRNMPAEVKRLLTNSSGLAIAFKTNSPSVSAQWTTKTSTTMGNMALIGHKGLNLYIKRNGKFEFAGVGTPTVNSTSHTATLVENVAAGEKECLIYLPLYDEITSLTIGVASGSTIAPLPNPFKGKVVVYGSSITQGASASRTGLAYPSIIGRHTGFDFINLGLSGSAKMEPEVADMIADINADAYILDCVPNASSAQITANTAPLVQKIRNRHPNAPIIMIQSIIREAGNFNLTTKANVQTQNNLFKTEYQNLINGGMTDLYLIEATDLLGHDHAATVDGTHPTDLGFERMIAVIEPAIEPILEAAINTSLPRTKTDDFAPIHIVSSKNGLQVTISPSGEFNLKMSVFDITGALFNEKQVSLQSNESNTIFVPATLGKGVYILRLQGTNYNKSVKFVVK